MRRGGRVGGGGNKSYLLKYLITFLQHKCRNEFYNLIVDSFPLEGDDFSVGKAISARLSWN
jgi:hypothetical protein